MDAGRMLLIVLGAGLALSLLAWLAVRWDRSCEGKSRYDERQQSMRGKAGAFGDLVEFLYFFPLILWYFAAREEGLPWEPWFLIFVGLVLKTMSYHLYCTFTDAILPLGESPKAMAVSYAGLALLQGLQYWDRIRIWRQTGKWNPESAYLNLIAAVCFLTLAVCYLIVLSRREKE